MDKFINEGNLMEKRMRDAAINAESAAKKELAIQRWTRLMISRGESTNVSRIAGLNADQITFICNGIEIPGLIKEASNICSNVLYSSFPKYANNEKQNTKVANVGFWDETSRSWQNLGTPQASLNSIGAWDEKTKSWKPLTGKATDKPRPLTEYIN